MAPCDLVAVPLDDLAAALLGIGVDVPGLEKVRSTR